MFIGLKNAELKFQSAAILVSAQNSSSLGCAILATATGRKDFDRHGRKADSVSILLNKN